MSNWPFIRAFALTAILTLSALSGLAYAASIWLVAAPKDRFLTPFMELTMADGWRCSWEGSEGVCQKRNAGDGSKDRSSIAIFAAKYRKPGMDSFPCYEQHLRTPIRNSGPDGTAFASSFQHLQMRTIGEYLWMDTLLLDSELKNYYTQYLATLTSRIGILVTFSVRKEHYKDRLAEIESMIQRLRIYESGGTAPYRLGDPANQCNGQPVIHKYNRPEDASAAPGATPN